MDYRLTNWIALFWLLTGIVSASDLPTAETHAADRVSKETQSFMDDRQPHSAELIHGQHSFYKNPESAQPVPALAHSGPPQMDWKRLMRPRWLLFSDHSARVSGIQNSNFGFAVTIPTYPLFGPPPPMIRFAYSLALIDSSIDYDLPNQLHEYSLGLSWIRPINDKWTARFSLSGAFATDMLMTDHNAWQLRGGAFLMYRPSERVSWAIGALATGRDDLPVIPGVGVIWQPRDDLKINLMMPRPRVSLLLADNGSRQHWGYVGMAISGGTWAYRRNSGIDDRVSLREWRAAIGWESTPRQAIGQFIPIGVVFSFETGLAFSREFEFDSVAQNIQIDNSLYVRFESRF